MAWVTVFVDDAVCGRLPPVCAKTGRPSDGRLAVSHDVRGASSVSTAWMLLLLQFPPVGWLILLVLALANPRQSEWLTVELPWSTEAMHRLRAVRALRRNLWLGAVVSLVGGFLALVAMGRAGAGELSAYRLGALALAATLVACVIGALVAEWRVGQASVAVDLDASRRWVTLRGVAPELAQAVRARHSRSDQPYPAP
jgi:hypothetical protein